MKHTSVSNLSWYLRLNSFDNATLDHSMVWINKYRLRFSRQHYTNISFCTVCHNVHTEYNICI